MYSSGSVGSQVLTDTTIEHNIIDNQNYKYSVDVVMFNGAGNNHKLYGMRLTYRLVQGGTQVKEISYFTNTSPGLSTAHPTPFAQQISIDYAVKKRAKVSIRIYDEIGRLVRTMVDETMGAGSYTTRWDGRDANGKHMPNGSYYCIVKTNGSSTEKVIHIR
jgi:hypothetical protein